MPSIWILILVIAAVPIAVALVRRFRPSRPAPKGNQTLPNVVHKGFHDHRRAQEASLPSLGAPETGLAVKVKINLRQGLPSVAGEPIDSFAMSGRVTQVRSHDQVSVDLVASGDAYPRAFRGHWRGVLERRDEMEFPWVLSELRPVS